MKYKTLKTLVIALRSGFEKAAYCSNDKEFVRITSEPNPGDPMGENGEELFECDDDEFMDQAFDALGITLTG